MVPESELQLALKQFVAVAAAGDYDDPVAKSSGQQLDGLGGDLSTVGDIVWALDGHCADSPRDDGTLLVNVLEPCLHGALVEVLVPEHLQECGRSVLPGEESSRARAVRLSTGLLFFRLGLRPTGDPGRAQHAKRSDYRPKERSADACHAEQHR
ncbi:MULTISPECIES: hypothetical protein [unclassified Streptomyces]|uniref:hypothetical protein n=1 Tax=unclassified Streptomyces TaxID=2593676 RepID=UPI001489E63D|nr:MULTISPECIES: hypothetical protein [unclassified Streptomyces]